MTFLLATRNRHKVSELRRLLKGRPIRILAQDVFPGLPSVPEDGATFLANTVKKSLSASRRVVLPVLAEDSGLEVRALRGLPGVRSARYAGRSQDSKANIAKLIKAMAGIPPARRGARFVCVMAVSVGGRLVRTFRGTCGGSIALKPAARRGFGYDPVFIPKGSDRTMAQLGPALKDRVSHRRAAALQLTRWLKKFSPAGPAD